MAKLVKKEIRAKVSMCIRKLMSDYPQVVQMIIENPKRLEDYGENLRSALHTLSTLVAKISSSLSDFIEDLPTKDALERFIMVTIDFADTLLGYANMYEKTLERTSAVRKRLIELQEEIKKDPDVSTEVNIAGSKVEFSLKIGDLSDNQIDKLRKVIPEKVSVVINELKERGLNAEWEQNLGRDFIKLKFTVNNVNSTQILHIENLANILLNSLLAELV